MQRWLRRFAFALCVLGALHERAQAEPVQARRARLTLGADPACATRSQLQARVHARDWQLADDVGVVLSLSASVQPESGNALRVTLRVDWPDGRSAERFLMANDCSAALDALALLINMTLDTSANTARPARPAAVRGIPSTAVPPPAASADTPVSEPAPPAAPSEPTLASAPAAVSVSTSAPALAEDVSDARSGPDQDWFAVAHVAVGALGALGNGTAPRLQPGLGVYAALALRGVGVWRPLLQLQLSHAWIHGVVAPAGRADFSWDGGQLSLCPLGVRWGVFAGYGCATLEAARLSARGYDTYQPRAQRRPWLGVGAALLLTAALWQRFELQLGAAWMHPLWRDQFAFSPQVFYAVPVLRVQLQLGLAVRFP